TLTLSQGEFTVDRPDKLPLHWNVPVIAAVAKLGASPASTWADTRGIVDGRTTLTLDHCGPVLVNAGQTGYFRTLYSRALFNSLRENFAAMPAIDQLGLMSDTWSLGLAGLQPASDIMDLVMATPADADTQVWGRAASALETIDDYYKEDPARQARFRAFALPKLAPLMTQVGWEARAGEPDTIAIQRGRVIGTLAGLGDAAVIAEAKRRYAARDTDPAAMPAALRKTIMSIVAYTADEAEWNALRAQAQAEKVALIKDADYAMLASSKDQVLAKRALELSLTDEPGATNTARMISTVAEHFPQMAFDFALAHMDVVNTRVDATSRSQYYPGLGSGAGDAAMIAKIQDFAEKYLDKGSRRSAETAMSSIRNRIKVRDEQLPAIDAWLAQHAAKTSTR
ncbi:MAG: ERAP1-like C-terminal domain-containing protein, partial [Arenimonas sp.]